jgi:alpha-galactosidase
MSKALNASGRKIHFNMCEWGKENPWEWGNDCAQSWRMSGDHTGTWASTKGQIQSTMKIPAKYAVSKAFVGACDTVCLMRGPLRHSLSAP